MLFTIFILSLRMMRRFIYLQHSALVLVLVMLTTLVTKSLHVYSHSLQILNEVTCCTCSCSSAEDSQDDDSKDSQKHAEHSCLICDYIVSPFLESETTKYDFILSVTHYTYQFTLTEDERSEVLVHKGSRAPPAHLLS